jgi:serine/alanine adding enzyme
MEESELARKLVKNKIDIDDLEINISEQHIIEIQRLKAASQDNLEKIKQKIKKKSKLTKKFKDDLSSTQRDRLKDLVKTVSESIKREEISLKSNEVAIAELIFQNKKETKPIQFENVIKSNKVSGTAAFFVRDLFKECEKEWGAFLANFPAHSSYHRIEWLQVLSDYSSFDVFLFGVSVNGVIVAAVPTMLMKSTLFGKSQISIPYVNYGGVLSASNEYSEILFKGMREWMTQNNVDYFELRTTHPKYELPVKTQKCSMILKLPSSDEALERELSAKVRAQYKKASKFEPSINFGGLELLDDFYHVFSKNMRDLGTPVYSKKLFERILDKPGIDAFLCIVKIDDKPVSTAFLSGYRDMLEIPWASTLKSANKYDSNMWMYRMILKEAIRRGYTYFDFGRTTVDSNTYKFKKQWGAESVPHYWYYLLSSDTLPETNPDNPKYKLFIGLWKKLPVWMANIVGPHIVRNIP